MKKCPFCAEEIKDEATKCKHCGSNLLANNDKKIESKPIETKPASILGFWLPILKFIGLLFAIGFAILLWYISIPAILLWYLWAKTKLSKKTKILITAIPPSLFVLLIIVILIISSLTPPPVLAISEPLNGSTVLSKSILIKGKVAPADVSVKINGEEISNIDKTTGTFSFQYDKLAFGNNDLKINYKNMHASNEITLSITRNATPEEQAELDKQKALEEEKARAEAKAKVLADMNPNEKKLLSVKDKTPIRIDYARGISFSFVDDGAIMYNDSKPEMDYTFTKGIKNGTKLEVLEDDPDGEFSIVRFIDKNNNQKIAWVKTSEISSKEIYDYCSSPTAGLTWTNEECERVKRGEIWIGMKFSMLYKERGASDTHNVSNYGNGKEWQWCWWNKTPSCFYDNNDDSIIDSYN